MFHKQWNINTPYHGSFVHIVNIHINLTKVYFLVYLNVVGFFVLYVHIMYVFSHVYVHVHMCSFHM